MPSIKGWPKGMDNVHEDNALPDGAARRIVNMDVLDSGKVRMRMGSQLALAIENAHSFWDDGKGNAYFLHDNQLKKFNRDHTAAIIGSVPANANRLAYVKVNGDIYYSCASARGRISGDVLHSWGLEVPTSPPTLAEAAGTLNPGKYHAAVTFLTDDGRESGASRLSSITLDVAGGIMTTAMPVPLDANITKKRLYLSTSDGDMLYMAAEVAAASQFVSIGEIPSGAELRTEYLQPPPFALDLAYVNGRIYGIDASNPRVVWHTEPFGYDHVDPRKNAYVFPEDVTLIAGTRTGLYVCSDQTYYIANPGLGNHAQVAVSDTTGIARTAKEIPNAKEFIWMTPRGAAIGHDGGALEILSEKTLSPGQMINAASMVREQNGVRQFVVVGNNTEGSSLQGGSFAEAEIIRRAQ